MTIVTSQAELNEKVRKSELDFALWNTHTLKEVYEHMSHIKQQRWVCTK